MAFRNFTPRGDLWASKYYPLVGGGDVNERNKKITGWWRGSFEYDLPLEGCGFPPGVTVKSYMRSSDNTLASKLILVVIYVIKTEMEEVIIRDVRFAINEHDGVPVPTKGDIPDEQLMYTRRFKNTASNIANTLQFQIFKAANCIPGADSTGSIPMLNVNFNAAQMLGGGTQQGYDISGNALAMAPRVAASSMSVDS